ncbi:MAG: endolytic transglycosylase MltG [Deferribacteraceae bacterium]|jgi:UPF0755 protein|nr:endolytic transglycosylase MltG [Deferribacteraceae bacterium]
MRLIKYAAVALILCITAAIAAFMIWQKSCSDFLKDTRVSGMYIIEQGSSYPQIYAILFGDQATPKGFHSYLTRIKKIDRSLHYGYYEANDISLAELLDNVLAGKETLAKVTFPEGYNMYDVAKAIAAAEIADYDAMMAVFRDRALVAELTGNSYESLEGFLAPGTYFFQKKHSPVGIARKMVSDFYASLPADFEAKVARQGLSFYDAVTLASIVQKETYSAQEAPVVASVYLNRIKTKMLLQADPTIIYGIYESFDGPIQIRYKDLRDASNRFNTYVHKGLTPTPIASPSAIALAAVAAPATTDYYYFVATDNGMHQFSRSYEEHARYVRQYQMR